ncbi:MAG: hypothetical protein ACR2P3_06215 [Geminicoccaceae bacterium]
MLAIWVITLLIVLLVIVPIAVSLLRRALQAARNIETYFRDMKEAGLRIAEHTAAVPALDQTIETAVAMKPVTEGIETKTGVVAGLLALRATKGGKP